MMKFFLIPFVALLLFGSLGNAAENAPALPGEAKKWLHQSPLQWNDLRGKVVLMNVWTFACWNSYRSLPWVVSLQEKYPQLQLIGIHSPEFSYEKDRSRLQHTMKEYNVGYPQLLDDNHEYWRALGNRYWPSFYIIDKQGKIRGKFIGETHKGDHQAEKVERLIQTLLNEA